MADLVFELRVQAHGDGVGILTGTQFHPGKNHEAPAGDPGGIDGGGSEPRAGAQRERGGECGGGGEPAEKRAPQPGVARMLIHEHAERATFAHELAAFDEPGFALEKLEPEPRAIAADFGVDVRIAERLKDRADRAAEIDRRGLGERFPASEMADGHDETAARGVARLDRLQAFDGHDGRDFRPRKGGQLDAGEDVRAEGGEVFAGQRPQLSGGFFAAKRDGQIVQDEPAVGRRDPVSERAERPAEPEDRRERQRAEQRGKSAVEREDDAIHQRGFFR